MHDLMQTGKAHFDEHDRRDDDNEGDEERDSHEHQRIEQSGAQFLDDERPLPCEQGPPVVERHAAVRGTERE